MIGTNFKDVTDNPAKRLSDSPLGKLLENFSETLTGKYDSSLAKETERPPVKENSPADGEAASKIEDKPLEQEDNPILPKPEPPILHESESAKEDNCDDNGKPYRTEDGGYVPNNTYEIDGTPYKTDDYGNIYSVDRKYFENDTFQLDGKVYQTDDNGNIIEDANNNETASDASETKETRELTDEEKQNLKDKLGWSDKQIAKCTIDEDGVIHYRTDREDLEGKTSENDVPYERKTVEINGIKVEGVFPVFDSKFDAHLPDNLLKASNPRQFSECNRQLKEAIENDPELAKEFTDEQLEDIENGDTPEGYTWHHNEETGKMQLVKTEDHDRTQGGAAHTGGKALWGGKYDGADNAEQVDTDQNNSEV